MEIPYSIVSEQDQNEWMKEWRRVECEQKREGFWDPKSWGARKQKGRDNESEQWEEEGRKVRGELLLENGGVAAWKAPPKWREICLQSVDDAVQWYSATCTIQSYHQRKKKLLKRNKKWLCLLDWCKHFRIVTWWQYGFKDNLSLSQMVMFSLCFDSSEVTPKTCHPILKLSSPSINVGYINASICRRTFMQQ